MPRLYLPADLKSLAGGQTEFVVAGTTVAEALADLESQVPGLAERLREGNRLKAGLAVAVDGHLSTLGLKTPVTSASEIHFLPAIGGG